MSLTVKRKSSLVCCVNIQSLMLLLQYANNLEIWCFFEEKTKQNNINAINMPFIALKVKVLKYKCHKWYLIWSLNDKIFSLYLSEFSCGTTETRLIAPDFLQINRSGNVVFVFRGNQAPHVAECDGRTRPWRRPEPSGFCPPTGAGFPSAATWP